MSGNRKMSPVRNRRDVIRDHLTAHLLDGRRCAVVCPSKKVATSFPIDGHLFGWFPPLPLGEPSDLLVVSFCPELMAEITEWLSDSELERYLCTIEAVLDGYFDAATHGIDAEVARERIESDIFDKNPDTLALFSEIELRALDAGIVPKRILTDPPQGNR